MKILAFSDLHEDTKSLEEIKKKVIKHKPDIIINCGDMSIFGGNLKGIINKIDKALPGRILTLPGNHESKPQLKDICEQYKNTIYMHRKTLVMNDYIFVGYGGDGFSLTDPSFESFSKQIENAVKGKKIVLITHGPPHNTKLDKIHGNNAGNKSYTDFIKKYKPVLAISGHLHENAKVTDSIGPTKLINPGWDGEIIEIQ